VADRKQQTADLVADVVRLDAEVKAIKARTRRAVDAAKTSLVDLHGVGPIVASLIIGHSGDITRFASRHPDQVRIYARRPGPGPDGRLPAFCAFSPGRSRSSPSRVYGRPWPQWALRHQDRSAPIAESVAVVACHSGISARVSCCARDGTRG
jgi:hypothetical protein